MRAAWDVLHQKPKMHPRVLVVACRQVQPLRHWRDASHRFLVEVRACALPEELDGFHDFRPTVVVIDRDCKRSDLSMWVRSLDRWSMRPQLLVLTDEPALVRATMRELGVSADVIRPPQTVEEIVVRLGIRQRFNLGDPG